MNSRNISKSNIVDICCNNLVLCVKCDKPSTDGYEVGNLITNNLTIKSKGFLAERFIKPPVILTFEFKCSIRIHYIAIFCKVGAQTTSGIELSSSQNRDQYETIGSGVLSDNKVGFVFHRHDINLEEKFGNHYFFRTFRSSRYTYAVQSLKLKIFRTSGTSVPALGKVEIWGLPNKPLSPTCNKSGSSNNKRVDTTNDIKISTHKLNSVSHALIHSKQSFLRDINNPSLQPGTSNHSLSKINLLSQSISIPEDFIDPITCEIMPQPLIMPSGKVIDNSTLEAYQKAEQQWGRGPSDPFTGVLFNNSNKPIVASDLKARIDKFLCDNSNFIELHKIPRTVGRNSSLFSNHKSLTSVSKLINKKSLCDPVNSNTQVDDNKAAPKRRKLELSTEIKPQRIDIEYVNSYKQDPLPRKSLSVTEKSEILVNNKSRKVINFQETMDHSLELALKSTLSQLPKLTADKPKEENKSVVCYNCNNCDNLFSTPCSHFICRQCLINVKPKEFMCSICKLSFKSVDVQKVHVK